MTEITIDKNTYDETRKTLSGVVGYINMKLDDGEMEFDEDALKSMRDDLVEKDEMLWREAKQQD